MKIAVLSGKGGTGKTLVSVNLAAAASPSTYFDCDVEEPNGHLFFKPTVTNRRDIAVKIPSIDTTLCNGCRKCVTFCKFNALAFINNKVKVFDEVCHSCGGCALLCPQKAISETDKVIGEIQIGNSEDVRVITGIMNTGEASGVPVIHELLKQASKEDVMNIIDCPPGSACVVMESIKDADYCVLVAEPTIFGSHNLALVYDLVKLFNKPYGVVLNKCLESENPSERFCTEHGIKILGRIPFEREIGTLNSNGQIIYRENDVYADLFRNLLNTVMEEVQHAAITYP